MKAPESLNNIGRLGRDKVDTEVNRGFSVLDVHFGSVLLPRLLDSFASEIQATVVHQKFWARQKPGGRL